MFLHSFEFDKRTTVSVLVVLFVVALIVREPVQGRADQWDEGSVTAPTITDTATTPEPEAEVPTPSTTTSRPAGTSGLTYEEAIQEYAGRRFQFVECRGTPGSMTMKKGGTFMLDNRDNETHTIKVGARSYTLGAYGFRIVTASDVGTLNITCDGGGAAQIIVQP